MRPLSAEHLRVLIDRMLSDLARMESMVTQILESMRLDRGRIDLRSEPVDLAGAVARVVAGFEERAAKDRIAVSTDIESGLQVMADPLALDVILRNLLENALAAVAPVGGGSIAFTGRRAAAGEVELAVRDSGVGFRPGDAARLFQKFTRLHSGRRQPFRHGPRPLHRRTADAASGRAGQRAERGRRTGRDLRADLAHG